MLLEETDDGGRGVDVPGGEAQQAVDERLALLAKEGGGSRGGSLGSRNSAGSSERTSSLARTSSERLLSWVEVASIACGQSRARFWLAS